MPSVVECLRHTIELWQDAEHSASGSLLSRAEGVLIVRLASFVGLASFLMKDEQGDAGADRVAVAGLLCASLGEFGGPSLGIGLERRVGAVQNDCRDRGIDLGEVLVFRAFGGKVSAWHHFDVADGGGRPLDPVVGVALPNQCYQPTVVGA